MQRNRGGEARRTRCAAVKVDGTGRGACECGVLINSNIRSHGAADGAQSIKQRNSRGGGNGQGVRGGGNGNAVANHFGGHFGALNNLDEAELDGLRTELIRLQEALAKAQLLNKCYKRKLSPTAAAAAERDAAAAAVAAATADALAADGFGEDEPVADAF